MPTLGHPSRVRPRTGGPGPGGRAGAEPHRARGIGANHTWPNIQLQISNSRFDSPTTTPESGLKMTEPIGKADKLTKSIGPAVAIGQCKNNLAVVRSIDVQGKDR